MLNKYQDLQSTYRASRVLPHHRRMVAALTYGNKTAPTALGAGAVQCRSLVSVHGSKAITVLRDRTTGQAVAGSINEGTMVTGGGRD
jgi:hypothetical protein